MQDFRKIAAWRRSHELTLFTYACTIDFPDAERFGLTQQMRKAAVSIESNIAEGSSRGSDLEFRRFMFLSLGSLAELETQAIIASDLSYLLPKSFQRMFRLIVAARATSWPLVKTLEASIARATSVKPLKP
jgi:four helix bundle protein